MQLYSIPTGFFKLDGGAMFGVVPKTLWSKIHAADDNNLCTWAMRCLLIEDGGKLILVDNGIGDKQDAKFLNHYYLHGDDTLDKSLAAHGFRREDITDVLLTHLHFDHCGGSIVRSDGRLVPAFKNATYWSHSRHWKWATEPNDREKASFLKENILPIAESGRLKFVDGVGDGGSTGDFGGESAGARGGAVEPGGRSIGGLHSDPVGVVSGRLETIADVIIPGLSVRMAYGHTDAMMLPQVNYKGKTVVFMADLLPSVGHIPIPYVMAYDMFPLTTLKEKKTFLAEAVDGGYVLFFEHDPENECCVVEKSEKGLRGGKGFLLREM